MTDPFLFPDLERIADAIPAVPRGLTELRDRLRSLPAGLPSSLTGSGDVLLGGDEEAQQQAQSTPVQSTMTTGDEPGSIPGSSVIPGSIGIADFASSITPVLLVNGLPTLPDSSYPVDTIVFNTVDKRLYKNEANVWKAVVDADDLSGQITAAQIQAGTITANEIDSNTITAGQIAAGAIGVSELAAGAVVTSKLAAGAATAGKLDISESGLANLIPDATWEWYGAGVTDWWELGAGWAVEACTWGTQGKRGRWRMLAAPSATDIGVLRTAYIAVPYATTDSYLTFVAELGLAYTSGTFRVTGYEYDKDLGLLTSWALESFTSDQGWPTHKVYRFKTNGASDPADGTPIARTLHASTSYIRLAFDTNVVSTGTFYVTSVGLYRGLVGVLDNTVTNWDGSYVQIDPGGIIIREGKLLFADEKGSTVLTGEGFSENWEDFLATGLYNGTFSRSSDADNTSDWWTGTDGTIAWNVVTKSASVGGFAWRYKPTGSASSVSAYLESALVPVTGRYVYQIVASVDHNYISGSPSVDIGLRIYWYKKDKVTAASTATDVSTYGLGNADTAGHARSATWTAPPDAHYAKVRLALSNGAGSCETDIEAVALIRAMTNDYHIPPGTILMWSGQTSNIPDGWYLCDGNNGTPNLTDRFIIPADSTNENTTGGSINPDAALTGHGTHSAAGGHTHGSHLHGNGTLGADSPATQNLGVGSGGITAADDLHGHVISGSTASATPSSDGSHTHDAHDAHPVYRYYRLCYIMKG